MPRQHGKSTITVDGDIITIKAIGSFNSEGITETIQELESVIQVFLKKNLNYSLIISKLKVERRKYLTKLTNVTFG